jgi:hypothetical protein
MGRHRPFQQLDLSRWSEDRELASLPSVARGVERRRRNRETAAWNALALSATDFFDHVQTAAERRGVWSEVWFPRPADPAAADRARLAAKSMRSRLDKPIAPPEYRFYASTADWLEHYARALDNVNRGEWTSPARIQAAMQDAAARWKKAQLRSHNPRQGALF